MGKGSRRITVRVPDVLVELIEQGIARRNATNPLLTPWGLTDWILCAIADKLSHQARSQRRKERFRVGPETPGQARRAEWERTDNAPL